MRNSKLVKPRVSFAVEAVRPHHEMTSLTLEEKRFLLAVERGDVASVRRMVEPIRSDSTCLNINCVDPLGRSGLLMAIDNENLEMVELLIEHKVDTKDALLHAINEEYVEAVEVLLEHEELSHRNGELHSWEAVPSDTATFTSDITPLILAAHRDNYEIIKILLDRGAQLPSPHSCRCGCEECVVSHQEDSLRHSRSRINSYRALASPSLIALSSKDPVLQAFELSWELRRLSVLEYEFKADYQELRRRCQDFATALLDHTRSSHELEVLLNHDPVGPAFEHGDRMSLSRLKLAIRYKQKKFVAHPNVQQLLASLWYEGLPGFRRKNTLFQFVEVIRIGILFPLFSFCYICAPHSRMGRSMRKPFIKFICHSASYLTFLASQRIESVVLDWFGVAHVAREWIATDVTTKRGAPPSLVEWLILAWVAGLIWSEIKQLWDMGLQEYISDLWNIIDFITNALYVATVALRIVAYQQVQKELAARTGTANLPRECWDAWDPMLIAEGLFGAANVFSSLKLVYIFSINPHLGPLQVTLSRMVLDIIKFAFLFVLTQFAFSCGLNQLLWYYADLEKQECFRLQCRGPDCLPRDKEPDACYVWRRFSNLFETIQTLFWAVFGLIDLDNFELAGAKPFTRFWGMFMFGSYSVINITVLLNLLIAMMNHSYQLISERADTEWKFARSKLWMSYFEEGGTVPPPFNIIMTPKSFYYLFRWLVRRCCGHSLAARKQHLKTVRSIMRNLVRRYVTREQRKADNQGVTEDDVNEVKQDISAFRYELIEILKNSGMNTSSANPGGGCGGRKNRLKERRLMKGFHLGSIQSIPSASNNVIPFGGSRDSSSSTAFNSIHMYTDAQSPCSDSEHGDLLDGQDRERSSDVAVSGGGGDRHSIVRRRWGSLLEAARKARVARLLTRSRSGGRSGSGDSRITGGKNQSNSSSGASSGSGSVGGGRGPLMASSGLSVMLSNPPPTPPRAVPTLTCDTHASVETEASFSHQSLVYIDDSHCSSSAAAGLAAGRSNETRTSSSPAAHMNEHLLGSQTAGPLFSTIPAMSTIPNIPGVQPIITRQVSQGWL